METSRQEILAYLLKTLQDLSQDWDYSREIDEKSLLFSELGLESLDAVVLGTSIQEHYRKPMPFAELLAELGREQRDLSVGQMVDFVNTHLNDPSQGIAAQRVS